MKEANQLFAEGPKNWLPPGAASAGLRYLYALANLAPDQPRPDGPMCRAGVVS
jgi:hypothetical protein